MNSGPVAVGEAEAAHDKTGLRAVPVALLAGDATNVQPGVLVVKLNTELEVEPIQFLATTFQ